MSIIAVVKEDQIYVNHFKIHLRNLRLKVPPSI